MKAPNNALLGSIAGVCIASAVVVGAVLGTHDQAKTPAQRPAGNPAPAAAAASTVTVTASARPTVQQVAKVSPSKRTAVLRQHQPNRPAAVVNQEPPVTDPTTTDPAADPSTVVDVPMPIASRTAIYRGKPVSSSTGVELAPSESTSPASP